MLNRLALHQTNVSDRKRTLKNTEFVIEQMNKNTNYLNDAAASNEAS